MVFLWTRLPLKRLVQDSGSGSLSTSHMRPVKAILQPVPASSLLLNPAVESKRGNKSLHHIACGHQTGWWRVLRGCGCRSEGSKQPRRHRQQKSDVIWYPRAICSRNSHYKSRRKLTRRHTQTSDSEVVTRCSSFWWDIKPHAEVLIVNSALIRILFEACCCSCCRYRDRLRLCIGVS